MTGTGRPAEMTVEFTEFERLRRIVVATNVSNMMVIDGELRFEPVAEGTKMTWVGSAPQRVYKLGQLFRRTGERQELAIGTRLCRSLRTARLR